MRTIISNRAFSSPNQFHAGKVVNTKVGDKLTVTNDVVDHMLVCKGYEVYNERLKECIYLTVNEFGALSQ